MNATSNLNLPSPTSRINSTISFTSTHVMNVLDPRGLLTDRVQFYHESFGFPVISTFCKALNAHHLVSLPGHLISVQVKKYLPFSKPMYKGHLDQEPQGLQSTKSYPTTENHIDRFPPKITTKSIFLYAACYQVIGKLYGDPTGRFVAPSISGNEYI